ncbi:hypothetical protein IT084_02610 [Desulfallas sp. Bu1-1]|uniref:hypothetical protein n=1 Tax=Desulfallas sp. Bu1-1 TaxID=2787620 RepID=UPI00189D02EF|nr:hypothetical protein [Desulfallas sp. Bu1-1]MBF7081866.1 hypothetical protein [Desulfallas sp. Bu1-1]
MKPGDLVRINAYGGKELLRRVVAVTTLARRKIVCVCTEEEWQTAQEEGREPMCVGFPLEDVREA